VAALADRDRFAMAAAKITISTVGPSPETFHRLARMPGTLAWSLHSPDDEIRRRLVPSTRHTAVELRDGLVDALKTRAAMRTRTIMVALTLIDGINDSPDDAHKLAEFLRPMLDEVPKIAIDLIPYNDIEVRTFTSTQPPLVRPSDPPLFDPPLPRSCPSSASRARSASAPFKT
jgi:23S rRNA (adenine2503-C2)-methyltransferase